MTTNKPEVNISNYTSEIYETAVDFGDAVSLDGSNDNVKIPHTDELDFGTNSFTVEAWVYHDPNSGTDYRNIVSKKQQGGTFAGWTLRLNDSDTPTFFLADNSNTLFLGDSNLKITRGEWHHLAGVVDSENGKVKLYVDGELVAIGDTIGNISSGSSNDLAIGGWSSVGGDYWQGKIDEVRIWNTARTEAQIQDNLYQKLDGTQDDLVAYYKFDEDSVDGNTVSDITENGNDGTLTNGNGDNFDSSLSFKGHVDIELDQKVTNQPGIILNYEIESDSTATQDEDFYNSQTDVSTTDGEPQTDSIFIAEGEDSARIYLTALPDAVVEGDENIKLTLLPDFNKALDLDGSNDYVSVGSNNSLDLSGGTFTLEAWIHPTLNDGNFHGFIGSESQGVTKRYPGMWVVGKTDIHFGFGDGNNWNRKTVSNVITNNAWNHVATTFDGTDYRLFVNGEEINYGDTTFAAGKTPYAIKQFDIGRVNNYFPGQIDEVRIWNTARTETEIQDTLYATLNGNEEPNLVAYYNFNDDSVEGNKIADVSANEALSFDGSNDYVNLNDSVVGLNQNDFTLEAWIKTTGTGEGIISKNDGGSSWERYEKAFYINGSGQVRFVGFGNDYIRSSKVVNDGEWHHVAVVWDHSSGTSGVGKIYVDGEDVTSSSGYTANNGYKDGDTLKIGRPNYGEAPNHFSGEMDEVRIWNTARSQSEIRSTLYSSLSGNENNLVAYYTFENGEAIDSTSNNNNGTINGATVVKSDNQDFLNNSGTLITNNKVLSLDGNGDYVQVANQASLNITDTITIEAYVYLDEDSPSGNRRILQKGDSDNQYRFLIENNLFKFDLENVGTVTSSVFSGKEWHHIAGVYDGSKIYLYIDGIEVNSVNASGSIGTTTNSLNIGTKKASAPSTDHWKGQIDEVRIWNTARSETEIQDYLNKKLNGDENGLVGYYNFEDSAANDQTSNGNNGSFNGDAGATTNNNVPIADNFTESLAYDPFATNGATYGIQSTQSAEITIQDSDNYVVDIVVANEFKEDLSDAANYVVVDENGNATFQVKLTSEPTQDVTVSISINSTTNNLTFTPSNWDTYQSVTTSSISNGSNIALTLAGGNYSNQTKQLSVSAVNNDEVTILKLTEGGAELELTPTVSISATNPEATEGNETESGVFTVSLDTPAPEGGLVIPFSVSSNATEGTDYNLYADTLTYSGESALSFDGVDDYVQLGNESNFDITGKITLEAWIKVDNFDINYQTIVSKGDSSWRLQRNGTNNTLQFGIGSGSSRYVNGTKTVNDGQWHHVAGVYDGTKLKLYIDGVLDIEQDASSSISTNNYNVLIGENEERPGRYFEGQIDEVRIWETARTEEEIRQNIYSKLEGTEDGLAAYYNFDNVSTTVPDLTGNGNDGTSYITGQSLSLDGSDDYVDIPNADELEFGTESFTVEAWVYDDPNSTNGWNNAISKKQQANVSSGWTLRIDNGDKPQFFLGDGSNRVDVNSSSALTEGEWYHLTGVVNRDTNEAYLYVNGELKATESIASLGSVNSGNSLKIGNWDILSNSNFWHGKIDEVRIWNKARTQSEIKENLDKKLIATEDGLVAYYNFDNDSGTTITDLTANANHGTIYNASGTSFVSSNIAQKTDWKITPNVVKIAEGETEATITVSKIDNEIAETAGETVSVTLEDWYNYDLNTSQQSDSITLKDDDEVGIEFAKLDTVGSVDNIAQEFIVSTAYDATTGKVGLMLNNGNNSYTFAQGTELTFDGGAVVTVDSQTTIAATGETLVNVTFTQDSPTNEVTADEISEIELVNIELSSFATNDTDAVAIVDVSLAQAPTEDVTVTLTDANGTATGTVSFTTSNWDTSQSVRMIVEEDNTDSSFDLQVSTTTANQQDANYGDRTFDIPISTETVATSLEFYNNTVVTSEVATIDLEVTSDYANGNVGLKLASGAASYTLIAGTQLSFNDGAVVTVDTDTAISTDDAGTSVAVSFTADSTNNAIATDETTEIEIPGADSTKFAVRLSSQPTDTVTLDLAIGDTTEGQFTNGASNENLTFTTDNWDSYQEVTLSGVDDTENDGNLEYSITSTATSNDLNYSGTTNSISVSNQDNDEAIESVEDTGNSSSIIASLSTVTSDIAEGSTGEGALKVTLSEAAPAGGLKVRYTVRGGTATPDEDFVDLQGFVERTGDDNPLSESQIGLNSNIENELLDFKLVDIDNDSDLDAVVIKAVNNNETDTTVIDYLENVGNSTFPDFVKRTGTDNPFDGLDFNGYQGDTIAFGDLNGDGNPDALIRNSQTTYYLENTTANGDTTPSFAQPTNLNINVGFNNNNLSLIDIDNDGSLELFTGVKGGTIEYYENISTGSSISFEKQDGATNPFDGVDVSNSFSSNTAPNFIDYDGDGDFDVFIGKQGGIDYYENIGSASSPEFEERTGYDNPANDIVKNNGNYPYLADIDNDGDIDLLNGEDNGQNITFYENTFFQEVEIAGGTTEAFIDISTIDDNIAENDETIQVSLSAKPSQTYSLTVTRDYATDITASIGSVGLQINETGVDTIGIPSGSVLTFSNGAEFTVSSPITLSSQEAGIVAGTLTSGTSIVSGETTDFTNEGYRLFGNIKATSQLGTDSIELQLDETNFSSLTLEEGTELTFSGGTVVKVSTDTTINNSSSTSVSVELSNDSATSVIAVDETTSTPVNLSSSVSIVDDDIAGITISGDTDGSTPISTSEDGSSGSKTFNVVLDTKPTSNVAVYFGSSNSQEGLLSDADETTPEDVVKLVFSPENWDTPQTVTLTSVDDEIDDGDISYKIITTVISDDIFYKENFVPIKVENSFDSSTDNSITLSIDDLGISQAKLTGGTQLAFDNGAVFTVDETTSIYSSESADVNLTLDTIASQIDVGTIVTTTDDQGNTVELLVATAYDGEDGTIGLVSTSNFVSVYNNTPLLFDNGASGTLVNNFVVADFYTNGYITEVSLNFQGYTIAEDDSIQFQEDITPEISVTNTDNDIAGVTVDKYDISSLEGYGNNFFNIKLDTKPVGEVTVTMNPVDVNGDKDYNISLADEFDGESYSITFNEENWNFAQAVEVHAVDDYDIEYNHTSYIDFQVSSDDTEDSNYNTVTPPDDIIVKIEDNDLPVASVKTIAGAAEAGSPGYFVVTLDNPAPDGFDGTGIVVNYSIGGTVDVDDSNGETNDLKPFTGSVRIAPGKSRSPIIAFPIDDFKVESIPLEVVSVSGNTVTLQIDTTKLSDSQKQSLIEIGTVTLDAGTELTFTDGAIANVVSTSGTLEIFSNGSVNSITANVEFTSDITTIATDESTSIPKEMVVVELSPGSDYSINESNPPSATLSIQDNDKPGIRIVEIDDTTVTENGTSEFYISLLSQPEADVTVTLAGSETEQQLEVTSVDTTNNTVTLKLADTNVDSLWLKNGAELSFGNATFIVNGSDGYFVDSEGVSVTVNGDDDVSSLSNGSTLSYFYTELGFDRTYTFNSDNWYKLQTVTVKGLDDNVAETGDTHTSTVEYTISSTDTNYDGFEVAPQTINIIDRTFDAENTTESLIEGFFALQDGLDSVSLPIVGNLDGVAPSFIEDFIGDLVTEIKQTEYITAESLQDTFNNVLSGRFGVVNVEITDLSNDNIEFLLGIEDSFTESISIDGDLGLPALGIGIESNGSLDANFDYGIDLAFGINTDDGFYINTKDTGFEVAASFGFSDDFSATGKLGFLQLDVANGDNVGGTGIDAEFVISMEDTNDSNGDDTQLTLSELNSLRKSDSLFDSIKYGFNGDAALDLDITTSIEGNTGFPSFGFNLSSELPLFNYSNADSDEEVSGAEVVLINIDDTSTTDTIRVKVNHTDPDANNSGIVLTKGTKLTFKDNNENEVATVILQENETLENGKEDTLKATLINIDSGYQNAVASLESGNFNLTFSDITLDLGGFVTDLMSPIISYVNELIEPFKPIIDVLQTEIEVLETLSLVDMFDENGDGSATLIEVASYLATTFGGGNLKYQKFFDAVTGIIDLVDTINDLEDTISSGDNLGVDFGDYTLQNFAAAGDGDTSDIDTSDTANSTNNLNSNVKNSAKNKGGSVKTKVKNFFSKLDDLGIGIPLLEDPLTAINLFLGQDVDLVTYDVPELDIEFNIRQEFPVPGTTIKGILEGGFSLYSDLLVGFDTYGLSQWKEADFDLAESYKILDGFYLSDFDTDDVDVDELTLNATIAAGVSASAVVAKAEITGGIRGTAGLDIIDGGEFTGTSDGKLRGSEVLEADSLFDLFSLSGSLDAFVKALVKVGIDLGFYEIMETVWEEEISVTLFEFELGGSSGTVSQSYIEGATVFFDANLNGILEEGEPVTTSNADGSYNLEIPLIFFDTNDNGKIDPEEGRIVTEGGTDSSSGVEIETPLIAPYGAKMVTPLTTLKQKLIEDGNTPESAEQLIKEALEIPEDIELEEFDALDAMSKGDERGTKVYKAHVQIQSLFAQTSEYIKGFGKDELVDEKRPIPEQAIEAIAKGIGKRKGKPPINFSDSTELEELIKEPLEGKFKSKPQRPRRLPESFDVLTKTMASGNKEIDEVFKGVPPKDILAKVAPVKKETQDKLPKELRKLVGGARREDITGLLERVPEAEQFLLKEQSQPGEPPTNGGEKPDGQQPPTNNGEKPDGQQPPKENNNKNPLPIVDSEDDTTILPRKPRKLAKGKRPRNLLELDGDDLTDTKIKFSLSSKNLPEGRIHEIAIFTTEDEEGTINGISPEDENYKQAALNKARSIFSILPDDFIANPKRIMKGFGDKNIGFLLIKNGTVDSARRGRTPLDRVLLGTETQGDGFRGMQISEKGENSFRLSFEDEMGDADFTDIVIDAELTEETPEIGTDIQGESEGEMIDLREYAGKQIQIQAPIVREESAYENVVGFYVVENKSGTVRDPLTGDLINPGEEGYIQAALRNSQNNAFQMGEKGMGGNKEIKGGHIFAPFAIANGTIEEVLDDDPDNDPQVYFAHIDANTDGVDHIRNLGGNTWGVEDMRGGGDMDFNDIVFKLDVTVR